MSVNSPTLVVYVAGASTEYPRAKTWISALRSNGVVVSYDWTPAVSFSLSQGAKEKDLPKDERLCIAETAHDAVETADLLWGLIPDQPTPSSGLWYELGVARANKKMIVVSGKDWDRTVFTEVADLQFGKDVDAFAFIVKLCNDRKQLLSGRKSNGDPHHGPRKGPSQGDT